MQDNFDVTTIVFFALALFVVWRLRSVLGQKTGAEKSPFRPTERKSTTAANHASTEDDNVVRLPQQARSQADLKCGHQTRWDDVVEPGSVVAKNLQRILDREPSYDPKVFLEGAKKAYEAIVLAFAKGDRESLKTLLSREVAEGFEGVITEREKHKHTAETTFVSIDKADIKSIEVKDNVAHVTVNFVSNLINATRDESGQVIDGNAETVVEVTDIWTFARSLGSRDPNWQLVSTDAGG